jgi:hypothetical protein
MEDADSVMSYREKGVYAMKQLLKIRILIPFVF